MERGLLDELRLIVHRARRAGTALAGIARPQELELIDNGRTTDSRVHLTYRVIASKLAVQSVQREGSGRVSGKPRGKAETWPARPSSSSATSARRPGPSESRRSRTARRPTAVSSSPPQRRIANAPTIVLKAHPMIDVELGTETFTTHKNYWRRTRRTVAETSRGVTALGNFQANTARRIRLFTLTTRTF